MKNLVRCQDVTVKLGDAVVLQNISFNVQKGELIGIIGPNGAGKTTLLRTLLGLVPLSGGMLSVLGYVYPKVKEARAKIGYMSQRQSFERNVPLSVSDVVATGLLSGKTLFKSLKRTEEKVTTALQAVGMQAYGKRSFQELSGGEQQRILLARAIVRQPELLLLDEPTTGLDFSAQKLFMELLLRLKTQMQLAIVLVSHDLLFVAASSDRLFCVNRTMHIHGRLKDELKSSASEEGYRCQFDLLSGILEERKCFDE